MKTICLILFAFISAACSAQNPAFGLPALGNATTGSLPVAFGVGALSVQPKFEPKKILKYDTVKCIVIYLDVDGFVKGESCLKISKATVTKIQYYPSAPCSMGPGCLVYHGGDNREEPDFKLFRVVTNRHKEIPLQSIIQYK